MKQHTISNIRPKDKVLSVDKASVVQQQVVLDESGQVQFGDNNVDSAVQVLSESETC